MGDFLKLEFPMEEIAPEIKDRAVSGYEDFTNVKCEICSAHHHWKKCIQADCTKCGNVHLPSEPCPSEKLAEDTDLTKKEVVDAFNLIDVDCNGSLSKEEFFNALKIVNPKCTRKVANK